MVRPAPPFIFNSAGVTVRLQLPSGVARQKLEAFLLGRAKGIGTRSPNFDAIAPVLNSILEITERKVLWNFERDLDAIVKQILLAVDSTDHVELLHEVPMIEEAKSELIRLGKDSGIEMTSTEDPSALAPVPALAQSLPIGLIVTPVMEDLLSKLVDAPSRRIGFCGMVS